MTSVSRSAWKNNTTMFEKGEVMDIWGFDLPLTPPSSPCSIMELGEETTDFCHRLQPVCHPNEDSIDEIDLQNYRKTDSIVIKDCMWGAHALSCKRNEYAFTRCSSGELPSAKQLAVDNSDVCNKLLGVDPTEVFPPLDERLVLSDFSSSDSDDDTDIDVVTVEPKLPHKIDDLFPKSPDIITPPKTPDSLPDTNGQDTSPFVQPITVNCTENSCQVQTMNATHKTSRSTKLLSTHNESFSRASHNVLERKRRNELKSKFYSLRDSVPELTGNKKVPKVVILKKAIDYIETMKDEEHSLKSEMQRQKKLHQELKKRLLTVLKTHSSS